MSRGINDWINAVDNLQTFIDEILGDLDGAMTWRDRKPLEVSITELTNKIEKFRFDFTIREKNEK